MLAAWRSLVSKTWREYAPGRAVVAVLVAGVVAGCASSDDDQGRETRSVERLYNAGMDQLADGDYGDAAESFEEVDRQHPYSPWAERAQVMAGYAYYREGDYTEAVLAFERYSELYPSGDQAAYAYYMRALASYERISDVMRDQDMTRQAHDLFREVVTRFPDSDYARDARAKRDLTRNQLAASEMVVGRFYQARGFHGPAIRRFARVVQDYQTTPQIAEALHRLVESYLALGLDREAQRSAAVLGHNYPGSVWYADSYALLADNGLAEIPDDMAPPAAPGTRSLPEGESPNLETVPMDDPANSAPAPSTP